MIHETGFVPEQLRELPESEGQRQEVLSERDERFLREGGKNVAQRLLTDFPRELPNALILTDTSARPLAYFFKPILRRAAEARRVSEPSIVFFQPNEDSHYYHREAYFLEEESAQKVKISRAKATLRRRAQEILRRFPGSRNFVLVDEYVMSGGTLESIREAFQHNIPAYGIASEHAKVNGIFIGMGDPRTEDDIRKGIGRFSFDYQSLSSAKGVQKSQRGGTVVEPMPERYQRAMEQLRHEMTRVGEIVAQELFGTEVQK